MKTVLMTIGVILTLVIGGVVFGAIQYFHYANLGNEFEHQIDATYKNNQNVLGQYSLKVKEVAKVSDKYTEALKDVVTGALTSRYGENGSQAVMQWIQEQNPTVDPSIFLKIQQVIESGRNEFQLNQTTLLDQCRIYKTQTGYLYAGFWFRLTGYPKEGLDKKCTPIVSEYSNQSFETGIEKGVDF